MQTEIFEYIRGRRGQRIGIVLAKNDNGVIRLGWSQCNRKLKDVFDLTEGMNIAKERMVTPVEIPAHIRRQYANMQERSKRYFKGCVAPWETVAAQ